MMQRDVSQKRGARTEDDDRMHTAESAVSSLCTGEAGVTEQPTCANTHVTNLGSSNKVRSIPVWT